MLETGVDFKTYNDDEVAFRSISCKFALSSLHECILMCMDVWRVNERILDHRDGVKLPRYHPCLGMRLADCLVEEKHNEDYRIVVEMLLASESKADHLILTDLLYLFTHARVSYDGANVEELVKIADVPIPDGFMTHIISSSTYVGCRTIGQLIIKEICPTR